MSSKLYYGNPGDGAGDLGSFPLSRRCQELNCEGSVSSRLLLAIFEGKKVKERAGI